MLKASLKRVRVRVAFTWYSEGSVLAGTIRSGCSGVASHLEIESDDDPALIAALVRNARGGCYAESTLRQEVEAETSTTLNGADLDVSAFPSKPPRRSPR